MSRIILKISGEALKDNSNNVNKDKLNIILNTINMLIKDNHKIGIVIGGGNFFRGREHDDMNKVTADTIGMLGTVMNALYIKDLLEQNNIPSAVSTPFTFPNLIPNYSDQDIIKLYDENNVIIFGGGIGKSGYSTDSGTILASEKLKANLIIKMTNFDGIYSDDPKINPNAIKFDKLTYQEVIDNDYHVMDMYAVEECKKNNIKILVLNFSDYKKIKEYFEGNKVGTIIEE